MPVTTPARGSTPTFTTKGRRSSREARRGTRSSIDALTTASMKAWPYPGDQSGRCAHAGPPVPVTTPALPDIPPGGSVPAVASGYSVLQPPLLHRQPRERGDDQRFDAGAQGWLDDRREARVVVGRQIVEPA